MRSAATLALSALAAGIATGGCGGDSADNSGAPPDELVGTYNTTLRTSDVAGNDAPELKAADGNKWILRIGSTGGPDDGPFLAIDVAEGDNLEAPSLRVEGDRLMLNDEECARPGGGYDFYDNEYTWSLDGDNLVIETVKNQCPDRVAETILTSRPWTKSG